MTHDEIVNDLVGYLRNGNPLLNGLTELPLDESLVELGYMDSFGVIDIVTYVEGRYSISIDDSDITKDKFGSINKMANLIYSLM